MNTEEAQNELNKMFGEVPETAGFKYKKSDFEYAKRSKGISCIFRIYLHQKTEWIKVEPAVFLGSSEVNKIFNSALGRNHPVTGHTCGFSIRNRCNNRGNYSLELPSEVQGVVESLRADFHEVAVPTFNEYGSLSGIESFLNKKVDGYYRPDSVSTACFGLIAAKLCENPEFEKIYVDSFEFCSKAQSPVLAGPITKVRDFLLRM